jgi:hypothetical protein
MEQEFPKVPASDPFPHTFPRAHNGNAPPWRDDPRYGGMSDHAAEESWRAEQRKQSLLSEASNVAHRIRLIPFNEIKLGKRRRDLVKGIIPRIGLTLAWGKPKCGKSFWAFDLLMHVALGWEYRGRRVDQGPIVYCSFEGQSGLEARVEAFRLQRLEGHSDSVPFFLQPVTLNLVKDHQALIKVIRETLGGNPFCVCLDTLNRSMPGSESSDTDMADYLKAADAIREEFDCAVIIIHHCGHEGTRPRGHSSLGGFIDCQIEVTRDAGNRIIAKVELSKDGPEGLQIVSALEVVTVGQDEDGEEITSCVVNPAENDGRAKTSGRWPKGLKLVYDAITTALLDKAVDHQVAGDGPQVRAIEVSAARSIHDQRYVSNGDGSNRTDAERKAWARNFKAARNSDLIGGETINGKELIWLIAS